MKPVQNLFNHRIPDNRIPDNELAVEKRLKTKLCAILLASMMVIGIFHLSSAIPSLTSVVIIRSTGQISTSNVTANSGSVEDIQAAVDAVEAAGVGNVYIPEGEFEFVIPENGGLPFGVDIPGGVNVFGSGENSTVLYMPDDNAPPGSTMFHVHGQNGQPVRISGITFKGYVDPTVTEPFAYEEATGWVGVWLADSKDFRLDHCSFQDFTSAGVRVTNHNFPAATSRGVIDHCSFDNPYKDIIGGKWAYGIIVGGDYEWESNIENLLGHYDDTDNMVYIEYNNFSRTRHAIASSAASGWYVARYNTFTEPRPTNYGIIDVHTGGRGLEAYNNVIIGAEGYGGSQAFWIRGGGGVIFNNDMQNILYGVLLQKAGDIPEQWVHDLYVWGNNMDTGTLIQNPNGYVENVDYFLYERSGYTPYPYPHPLTLEE